MSGDVHVRICERVGVQFPRATRRVILCNGTRAQAEEMKGEVHDFLKSELDLTLSLEKTKITHITEGFKFLGYWLRMGIGRNGKPQIKMGVDHILTQRT